MRTVHVVVATEPDFVSEKRRAAMVRTAEIWYYSLNQFSGVDILCVLVSHNKLYDLLWPKVRPILRLAVQLSLGKSAATSKRHHASALPFQDDE